jgi:hypothetical protein
MKNGHFWTLAGRPDARISRVLEWLNLTAPQLKNIQANAPPKNADSISI